MRAWWVALGLAAAMAGRARRPRCRCGWVIRAGRPTPSCTRRFATAPPRPIRFAAVLRRADPARLWRRVRAAVGGEPGTGTIALARAHPAGGAEQHRPTPTALPGCRADRAGRGSPFPEDPGLKAEDLRALAAGHPAGAPAGGAGRFGRAGRHPGPDPDQGVRPRRCLGARPARRGGRGLGRLAGFSPPTPGVPGPLPDPALLLHRPQADPAAGAGVRRPPTASASPSATPSARRTGCSGSGLAEPAGAARRRARGHASAAPTPTPASPAAATTSWPTTAPAVISRTGKWLTEWIRELPAS